MEGASSGARRTSGLGSSRSTSRQGAFTLVEILAALLMMAEQIATLGPAAALLLWSHVESVERELAT